MSELILKGKVSDAKVFTHNIDDATKNQIVEVLEQSFVEDANVRIMPDCHAGKGSVIGTTMKVKDKVVPNLVGVDIGCGMLCVELKTTTIDFAKLDHVIREFVPSGINLRETPHELTKQLDLESVIANFSMDKALRSLGTLGGGNHFIEMNQSEDGKLYLVIHSGSRHLGVKVANYHQKKAVEQLIDGDAELKELIHSLKEQGRHREIQEAIKNFKTSTPNVPKELAYVTGTDMDDYLHDLRIAQDFAKLNRAAMAQVIIEAMGFEEVGRIDTVHNYIDLDHMILRKGAISAQKDELVLIPINMRDGSILAKGKGNPDWNYSGPHGAGRILSRTKAKKQLQLDDFQETMKGVYSTSISEDTIDESPFAYKPMDEIIENTKDAIEILSILKPLYNFKAPEFTGWSKKK